MTAPLILAFCAAVSRDMVRGVCPDATWHDSTTALVIKDLPGLILLAYGPEGGAALAGHIEAHGLVGVRAIVLVGVTAPRAPGDCTHKREPYPGAGFYGDAKCGTCNGLAAARCLGPLEPLRAVAERTRRGTICSHDMCAEHGTACTVYPLRFIVACAPDDGVCRGCGGSGGMVRHIEAEGLTQPYAAPCDACSATGKRLSSADVARELSGIAWSAIQIEQGGQLVIGIGCGFTVIHYPTSAELAEHGIRAALQEALK